MSSIITAKKALFKETSTWAAQVVSAGGSFESNSVAIANNLVRQIKNASFGSKIIYLLPMLGRGIGAARVPLIDVLNVGAATNGSFVDTDFSQATGLQGGTNKYLDTKIVISQLNASHFGGFGFWDNNINTSGSTYSMASVNTAGNLYGFYFNTNLTYFGWGVSGGTTVAATVATTPTNGDFYGQRSSTTDLRLFKSGSKIATTVTTADSSSSDQRNIIIMRDIISGGTSYLGRCAIAYLTDGTLSDADVANLDALLGTYLIVPASKP